MYSPSSSRSLIRSACSVVVLLGAAALGGRGAAAQQPDEALVSELALVRSVPGTSQGPPQTEAVTALARIGGDDGARALRELLGLGTTAGVATSAVQSAALLDAWRLGPRAPVPALIGYARDPDVTGRWHALYSLARLRVARAVTTLLDALQDPQPMVRAVAVRGVSRALSDTAKLAPQDVVTRIPPLP